ncbi:hypothetical protein WG909_01150 [Peptostreptococcaceae bacterium AGR-M142]
MKLQKALFIILSLLIFIPFSTYANEMEEMEKELEQLPTSMQKSIGFGDIYLDELRGDVEESEEVPTILDVKKFRMYNYGFLSSLLKSKNDFIEDGSIEELETKEYVKENPSFDSPIDFKVIRHFKNIEEIHLMSSYEDFIMPDLTEFKNLKEVTFNAMNFKNFDFLKNCKTIKSVRLYEFNTNINDLDVFSNMNLECFMLTDSNMKIKDLSFLKNSKNLKKLNLKNVQIEDVNLIYELNNLQELKLENVIIKDFELKNLKKLYLKDCKIENLKNLKDLKNLEILSFENVDIENVDFLENMNNLNGLALTNMKIKNLPNLSNTALDTIYLEDCQFENLDSLKNCKALKYVDIKNIHTLDELSFVDNTNLYQLDLDDLSINSLKVNENIDGITLFNLNNISSLDGLKNGINLSDIEISNLNNLKDLEFLKSLEILDSLKIRNLNNTDISVLNDNLYINESLTSLELENIKSNKNIDLSKMVNLEYIIFTNLMDLNTIVLNDYSHSLHFNDLNDLKNIKVENIEKKLSDDESFLNDSVGYHFDNVNLENLSFLNSYNSEIALDFSNMKDIDFSDLDSKFECDYLTIENTNVKNLDVINNFNDLYSLTLDNMDLERLNLDNRYMSLNSLDILNMKNLKELNMNIYGVDELKIVNCKELESINNKINSKPAVELIHIKNIKLSDLSFLENIKSPQMLRIKNDKITNYDKLNELDTISYIEIYNDNIDKTIIDKLLNIPSLQDIIINAESYKGDRALFL